MRVPVLDQNRTPLMPTTPARARRLLAQGKAKAYRNKLGLFCLLLKRTVEPNNQPIAVGIDPGSKFEGFSVVGTKDTVLNGMSEAPTHVKKAVEQRRTMRRARRHRKCRRRPVRFNNRLRNKETLPPSTFARWNAKLRILKQLVKILPITDVVVEDVKAITKKGQRRWNVNFSPLEQGKAWFYEQIRMLDLNLHTRAGFETKELRERFGVHKISEKGEKVFTAHAVDAWVLAADITGASHPTERGLFYWVPIRLHRRQLHRLQPSKGGVRKSYGSTRSWGFKRGTLVEHQHPKFNFTYIGGMQRTRERVSLHCIKSGTRLTQHAKRADLRTKTTIAWRPQFLPSLKGGGFLEVNL